MKQEDMFSIRNNDLKDKFKYAMLLNAVGDSLGWPLEFAKRNSKRRLKELIGWKKLVGGRWWGYQDDINVGDYSDDTQLTLSLARSIGSDSKFRPDYFGYLELPLWLHYERGGGRAIKTAARNLLKKGSLWNKNIYKGQNTNYFNAGANGAAMRNLPISMVHLNNDESLIQESFKNTIITHGHPRAIIGTLMLAGCQSYFFRNQDIQLSRLSEYLEHIIQGSFKIARKDRSIESWVKNIPDISVYENAYSKAVNESSSYILQIERLLNKDDIEYYNITRALNPKFKGSGISTAAVSVYLAVKYLSDPEEVMLTAINFVGSDTDTIGGFVGSLIGAFYGSHLDSDVLSDFISKLQDKEYIEKVSNHLWKLRFEKQNKIEIKRVDKSSALLRILAWEIGLHEMFWEALREGDIIFHPTLGKGKILIKSLKPIRREGYSAKIFKISFDIGQTAYFHSRISDKGIVASSIARETDKNI